MTFVVCIIFCVLFLLYLGYLFVIAKKGTNEEEGETKDYPIWKCILFMVIGGVLVVKGSDFAVSGASAIARYFGMSERFNGLTIVALGTSLPELVTSIVAARKNEVDMALGNAVGSCIFNILMVLGIASAISPIAFIQENIIDIIVLVVFSLIVWIMAWTKREIKRGEGIIMLLMYAAYTAYIIIR